jgi:hypothetical protein
LRIHFLPEERHRHGSPLADGCMSERRVELQALVSDVQQRHPEVRKVRGFSWLYNLKAYKRLFPPQYVQSLASPAGRVHLTGSSTWGQVLDHRHEVKPTVADQVLAGLTRSTVGTPWQAFPLQPLEASCSFRLFADWFA